VAQTTFSIKAGGTNALMPADTSTSVDPTVLTTTTVAVAVKDQDGATIQKKKDASTTESYTTPMTYGTSSGTRPYFVEKTGIDVAGLTAIMEATNADIPEVTAFSPVVVTVGSDSYKGYKLADVIVRATKFYPSDYNAGAFGTTTAVIAFGKKTDGSGNGRVAAFSFNELVRTANGDKTIVAYEKNGSALSNSEGKFAIIAGNDTDPSLRKVERLSEIHLRNDYVATSLSLINADNAAAAFTVKGAVNEEISVTTGAVSPITGSLTVGPLATVKTPGEVSTATAQGYYAVDKVGSKNVGDFKTYYFQDYGPRHMNYWWGQGIRLTDVLDTAGLKYPDDKGACFVVVTSANNQPALFSCGELYNSPVGVGDGLAGSSYGENRSRSKGVLLVTDDFRTGGGNVVMMGCWVDISNCTATTGGKDAADPATYATAMNTSGNQVNKQMIALISTEDKVPLAMLGKGRWFPLARSATATATVDYTGIAYTGTTTKTFTDLATLLGTLDVGDPLGSVGPVSTDVAASTGFGIDPWISVGDRLQQNIKTMTVYYAASTGNAGLTTPTSTTSGALCTHDQIMSGECVKADKSACTHLDYMAGTPCYLP
jgi:hypothetical protein